MHDKIKAAMAKQGLTHYTMSLTGDDILLVVDAVNQGIDAHLTACNCPARGDSYQHAKRTFVPTLECKVSAESLPVLLRRLEDSDNEDAWNLRSDILSTLEFAKI
jgi:hypothetical protein